MSARQPLPSLQLLMRDLWYAALRGVLRRPGAPVPDYLAIARREQALGVPPERQSCPSCGSNGALWHDRTCIACGNASPADLAPATVVALVWAQQDYRTIAHLLPWPERARFRPPQHGLNAYTYWWRLGRSGAGEVRVNEASRPCYTLDTHGVGRRWPASP